MTEEPTSDLTILFADICRSTDLFENLGDQVALNLIMKSLDLAQQCAKHNNGTIIGTIGDELMCTFEHPEDALATANQVHALMSKGAASPEHPLSMRVGINSGAVLNIKQSVYGDTVNIAARLATQAKANQSLVSGATISLIKQGHDEDWRLLGNINLKGKAGPLEVYELLQPGEEEEITEITAVSKVSNRSFLMTAKFRTRHMNFDPTLVRFLFGRNMSCDLVIDHPTISREHAEFQYNNGQFIFRDFSSNGSVVVQNNNKKAVHRSGMELRGNGKIYLGRTLDQPNFCIDFSCDSVGGRPFR